MLVFEERGKPQFPEKNLSEQSSLELSTSALLIEQIITQVLY